MIGQIAAAGIGGGMKALGSIAGGIMGANSARKQKNMIKEQQKQNQTWYDKRYNENSTERADAVSALEKMRSAMNDRTKAAQGVSAVMGGTMEGEALEKQAQTNAMGNTISEIAKAGEARKESIEGTYMARSADLSSQLLEMERNKAAQMSQAVQGVANAGGGIAGGLLGGK